ncbi:(deoxy)nucleoside triphosphate pyrophosphohydrolase [Ancylomarina sp. 16SWW S1-10-2]|uniref:(deoxy)nucleoside triphosphate pyrophosphohydrolase n=1 Tax=Ancylomarina sp. 16SWW S1-10-2 TaxID=2499681 RepID=UPI0012AD5136|nr:(deoxy)nucleoside triphosphate pyrophosphohydrolase [Ancylomarina sp. 16SWW S1-10-2]MRT94099.1 (deoxy)nucleoside triphosphate pyrophosphohydrolase [Ancylomarina sp. 16SWW S1-10-2]
MTNKKIIQVTAAIIRKDNRFLCAQRNDFGDQGGKWEFPGGKTEIGETPEFSLERELHEEFNIKASCGDFLCENTHDYGDKIINLKAYFINYIHGDFQLLVHKNIKWLSCNAMLELDWAEADLPIVHKLIDHSNLSGEHQTI